MVSRLGEGTTFTVELTLPEEEAILDVIPSGRVTRLAPDQRPWTLLVVDDRIENRELLAKLFTRVGFRVLLADSGEEGLALWEKERPDLIWMDIRMPGMDGYEALHHLRDLESRVGCARTPVIAITASVMDQDDVSMRAAGFDGFVTKPFREADLYEAMARLLPVRFETA
jgi:CheY-like chemotaxis protein